MNALYEGRELTINFFKSGLFPMKSNFGTVIKLLTTKPMLQRLRIALPQVKAGNTTEKLLNGIRQLIYSLYQAKKKLLRT